jgi:hypothetical protein
MRGNAGAITTINTNRSGKGQVASIQVMRTEWQAKSQPLKAER